MMRERNNSLNLLFYFMCSICLAMVGAILLDFVEEQLWFTSSALLIIVMAIVQICFLKGKVRIISLTSVFLVFTYLFHFGIIIVKGLFTYYDGKESVYSLYALDFDVFKQTVFYSMLCVLMLGFGLLAFVNKNKAFKTTKNRSSKVIKMFGYILLLFGLPFLILQLKSSYEVFTNGSYLDSFDEVGTGSGVQGFMYNVFYAGLATLIVSYSSCSKKYSYSLLFIGVAISVIDMLFTGGRGHQILIIVVMGLIAYNKGLIKATKKTFVLLFVITYFAIVMVNTIADIRTEGMSYFSEAFGRNIRGDAIFDILIEMGSTIYTPYLCIAQENLVYETAWGSTYLCSFINALPNYNEMFTSIIEKAMYVLSLDGVTLGGSFIGEAYYNFRYLGIIICGLIGGLVEYINNYFERACYNNDAKRIAMSMMIVPVCIWWVRDCFAGFIRPFVWGGILFYILFEVASMTTLNYKKEMNTNIAQKDKRESMFNHLSYNMNEFEEN